MTSATTRAPLWLPAALSLAGIALFAAAYCQAPLYYSNQNQYFLHGLARAGEGDLADDWLAQTKDPTPAFSTLVEFTARSLPRQTFYAYYALLQWVYAGSLFLLFWVVAGEEIARRRWPAFLALLFLTHAAFVRWLSQRLVGFDYPWFLQAGLAGQYVLGGMLQPSSFGILLVAAVALFALDRPLAAAAAIGLGGAMHSTYLLPGALLTLGFQAALLLEGRWREALGVGVVALLLVLPGVLYALSQFQPTPYPEGTFAESQKILSRFRIPHHTQIGRWLDLVAWLQIGWMALALALLCRTRLFVALAVPFALAAMLTVTQAATGNDTLALLFPWRLSAVLMPVATAVILTRLVALKPLPLGNWAAWVASVVVIVGLAGAGVWIMAAGEGFRSDEGEEEVLRFVRENRSRGDIYFLPVKLPDTAKARRGSLSSDFEPLREKKNDPNVIPIGLQRFRLHTGAAIYVDFKSIPYKDVEVVRWRRRLDVAEGVTEDVRAGRLEKAVRKLRRMGVTHLVWPAGQPLSHEGLRQVHEDSDYRVYRVLPAGK
jgi:hypothetical protein